MDLFSYVLSRWFSKLTQITKTAEFFVQLPYRSTLAAPKVPQLLLGTISSLPINCLAFHAITSNVNSGHYSSKPLAVTISSLVSAELIPHDSDRWSFYTLGSTHFSRKAMAKSGTFHSSTGLKIILKNDDNSPQNLGISHQT